MTKTNIIIIISSIVILASCNNSAEEKNAKAIAEIMKYIKQDSIRKDSLKNKFSLVLSVFVEGQWYECTAEPQIKKSTMRSFTTGLSIEDYNKIETSRGVLLIQDGAKLHHYGHIIEERKKEIK